MKRLTSSDESFQTTCHDKPQLESFVSSDSAKYANSIVDLYGSHHSWLRNWLTKRLGCTEQAADFAHDTFVRVLATAESHLLVERINTPRGYLLTLAKRVMVDHFRRHSIERAYIEVLSSMPEDVHPSPESQMLGLEALCQIDQMLDGLGTKAKQAFLLSQIEGFSYQEIADQLEVSLSSVKKYMVRAIEHSLLCLAQSELD